jgi:hypothetical protein
MDLGLLILRVVFGLTLTAHSVQKLFGWFGGPGRALRRSRSGWWVAACSASGQVHLPRISKKRSAQRFNFEQWLHVDMTLNTIG